MILETTTIEALGIVAILISGLIATQLIRKKD